MTGEATRLRRISGSIDACHWLELPQSDPEQKATCHTSIPLAHLCLLDLVLDLLLLASPVLRIPPPNRALVFALDAEVIAGTAGGMFLVAFLPAQTTCEAACRSAPHFRTDTIVFMTYQNAIFCATCFVFRFSPWE